MGLSEAVAIPAGLVALAVLAAGTVFALLLVERARRLRAERALRDRNRTLELALEGSELGLWDWDVEANQTAWVGRLHERFAEPATGESTGGVWECALHPEDRDRVLARLRDHLEGRAVYDEDYRLRLEGGGYRWFRARGRVRIENGRRRMYGSIMDITAQKEAEQRLEERTRFINLVAQAAPAMLYVFDILDRKNVYANDWTFQTLGRSRQELDELGGELLPTILHPDSLMVYEEHRRRLMGAADGEIVELTYRVRDGAGAYRALEGREMVLSREKDGLPRNVVGVALDVTQRLSTETELRESRARFARAVNGSNDGIWDWDTRTGLVEYSARFTELLGYDEEEFGSRIEEWTQRVDPAQREEFEQALAGARAGRAMDIELRMRTRSGELRWFGARGQAIMGDLGHVAGSLTDIQRRKESEEALARSEKQLAAVIGRAPTGIIVWDTDFRVARWNPAAAAILGYSEDEAIGMPAERLVPEKSREHVETVIAQLRAGVPETNSTNRNRTKSGEEIVVEWYNATLSDDDGAVIGFVSVFVDITHRLESETRLRESEARFRTMADAAPVLIWVSDRHGNAEYYNRTWLEYTGATLEDELNGGWERGIHPDDRERVLSAFQRASGKQRGYEIEYRLRRKDGTYGVVLDRAAPRADAQGEFAGFIGSAVDITELRAAEVKLQASAARLREAQRIGRMGDWRLDPATWKLTWSEEMFRIFGRDPASGEPSYAEYLDCFEPRSRAMMEAAVARTLRDGADVEFDVQARPKCGAAAWQHVVIMAERERGEGGNGHGVVRALIGTVSDITDRKRAEDQVRALLNALPDYMLRVSREGNVLSCHVPEGGDGAAAAWTGRNVRELLPEPLAAEALHEIDRCLRGRRMITKEHETGERGRSRNWEIRLAPCGDSEVMALVRDITQRRAAERERELMLGELDHRVKNNLATVISIADQTARGAASTKDFLDAFRGRLRALSRVHSALARSKWEGARITEVVRPLEVHSFPATGPRVELTGEDLMLPSRPALALSRALHELATNAAKYGALTARSGVVRVCWEVVMHETLGRSLRVVWEETGGPTVSEPQRRGFGCEMIEQSILYEVHGRSTLEFRSEGVRCEMIVPLREDQKVESEAAMAAG